MNIIRDDCVQVQGWTGASLGGRESAAFSKHNKSRTIAGVMSFFDEIQDEILSSVPLSTVFRKAKVLALHYGELKRFH